MLRRHYLVGSLLALSVLVGLRGTLPADQPEEYDPYRQDRLKMVQEQIVREGIKNDRVLQAMREVPRHLFVPEKFRAKAYQDVIIGIGYKQTISTAYIVAYMTEAIDPQPTDRVLEIGTGSGYQAAVLSKLVHEVYTIEIVEPLGREAGKRLRDLGYRNVHTRIGDGFKGWPEAAPFDKILVTCSPETVPQPLADQLREGGKLIIPLGDRYHQAFYLYEKHHGQLDKTRLLPTLFVPMTGLADQQRRLHPDPVHPRLLNGGFEEETNGVPDAWFYLRQGRLMHQGAPEGRGYLVFTNEEPGRDAHVLQGLGIDGKKVRAVSLSFLAQGENIRPGPEPYHQAGLAILFFDSQNRPLSEGGIWPLLGTFPWVRLHKQVPVPRATATARIQLGLRGATGRLSVDDVRLKSYAR